MSSMITADAVYNGVQTSRAMVGNKIGSVQRLPTDPIYKADVVVENAVNGTRYLLLEDADHSNVLSSGVINADPFTIVDVPAFGDPFLMLLRLRTASSSPFYKTFETKANHVNVGVTVFVIQELDE